VAVYTVVGRSVVTAYVSERSLSNGMTTDVDTFLTVVYFDLIWVSFVG